MHRLVSRLFLSISTWLKRVLNGMLEMPLSHPHRALIFNFDVISVSAQHVYAELNF